MIKLNCIALNTLVRKEIIRFCRIWTQTLLPSAISMSLYFVIFGQLIGKRIGHIDGFHYIEYIAPGLIMMSVINNAFANVVASFYGAKFQRSIEEMLVSPMSPWIIISGFVIGGTVRGCLVGILVTIVALFFTNIYIHNFGIIALAILLTAILFSLGGLINGIFSKSFDDINIIPTFVLTPLTYFGGVFYSLSMLPNFWQKLSYLNPVLYMINAFRYGMLGVSDVKITGSLFVIALCDVLLFLISGWLFIRGSGLKA